jgi:hypothetical protein
MSLDVFKELNLTLDAEERAGLESTGAPATGLDSRPLESWLLLTKEKILQQLTATDLKWLQQQADPDIEPGFLRLLLIKLDIITPRTSSTDTSWLIS